MIIRLALRAGLPAVANRFQAPRPEGYFANDYGPDRERVELCVEFSIAAQRDDRIDPGGAPGGKPRGKQTHDH